MKRIVEFLGELAESIRSLGAGADFEPSALENYAVAVDMLAQQAKLAAASIDQLLATAVDWTEASPGHALAMPTYDLAKAWTALLDITVEAALGIYGRVFSKLADHVAAVEEHLETDRASDRPHITAAALAAQAHKLTTAQRSAA